MKSATSSGTRRGRASSSARESGLFSKDNVIRTNKFFDRFGPFAIIAARFVPIVRTFAPVAAGVGHMNYRRYSLYNAVGAVIWGTGLTFAGFLLGYIPPLADFVIEYIDVILLIAVACAVVPTAYHAIKQTLKARKANREGRRAAHRVRGDRRHLRDGQEGLIVVSVLAIPSRIRKSKDRQHTCGREPAGVPPKVGLGHGPVSPIDEKNLTCRRSLAGVVEALMHAVRGNAQPKDGCGTLYGARFSVSIDGALSLT